MQTRIRIYLILLAVTITGAFLIYLVDKTVERKELEKRKVALEKEGEIAATHFKKGIENYAVLVSGLRSHIENSPEPPTKLALQRYLKSQYQGLVSPDSIILSFLDTNNVFHYSITHNSISTNELAGSSVDSLRSDESTSKMKNELLHSDDFILFQPINLVEGFVGIALCFRLVVDDVVQGFFAPTINFESIVSELYEDEKSKDFIFRFSTNSGLTFDRVAVYDETKIYNNKKDLESYKSFELEDKTFASSSFSIYGNHFKVEAAYKKPYVRDAYLTSTFFSWCLCLLVIVGAVLIYWEILLDKNRALEIEINKFSNANEGLKNYAIAVSHDLKEPLRTIGSFSSLLKRRYGEQLDEEAISYLEYIVSGATQMNQLLNDLLKYSTLIHSEDLHKEKVAINKVIQDVENNLENTIRTNNVTLKVGDLPAIQSNRSNMYQLFQNFISNAIKFNDKANPQIVIGSKQEKNHTLFFVKDNGIGIQKEYQDKIFEIFQRLSREEEGSGIGLAICKKIVDQHEGELWVDSEEGKGATFYFRMPNVKY